MEDKNTFEEKFTVPCSFRVKELEKTIEGLQNHIAMLQNDLYNEQLRNENLSDLALAVRSDMRKPEDN